MVHFPSENTQPGSAKTVADILTAAADLIDKPGAWTQYQWARNAAGQPVGVLDGAVCWDIAGAIVRVAPDYSGIAFSLDAALKDTVGKSMSGWNDAPGRTQSEAVAALRAAAVKARTPAADTQVGTGGEAEREPKNTPTNGDSQ